MLTSLKLMDKIFKVLGMILRILALDLVLEFTGIGVEEVNTEADIEGEITGADTREEVGEVLIGLEDLIEQEEAGEEEVPGEVEVIIPK
jgi:hypothetical protein